MTISILLYFCSLLGLSSIFAPIYAFYSLFQATNPAINPTGTPPTWFSSIRTTFATASSVVLFYSQISLLFASVPFVPYISIPLLIYYMFPSTRPIMQRVGQLLLKALLWIVTIWYKMTKDFTLHSIRVVGHVVRLAWKGPMSVVKHSGALMAKKRRGPVQTTGS